MVDLLPPDSDTEVVDAEALFPEAKQRARRRHLLIGGAAILLSAALIAGVVIGLSRGGGSAPPPPHGFASGHLDEIVNAASSIAKGHSTAPVPTALIYATTRKRAYDAGTGMDPNPGGKRVYVVVFKGHFMSSRVPPGGIPPTGTYMTVTFNPPGEGDGGGALGIGDAPPGPGMGQPYTLVLK